MKIESNGITIHLEQYEIKDFWNIIMFALVWHQYAINNNESKMTESELKLASELADTTDKIK